MKPDTLFWRGKRVLLTGHSGFKGSWLALWLSRLGAEVTGVSLPALTQPNLASLLKLEDYIDSRYQDIRNSDKLSRLVRKTSPDIVFHLAAQPLVRASYRNPLDTLNTNIMGTAHVLEAIRGCEATKAAVIITTDKVYKNREWVYPYRETDTLGGHDPYSSSKAAAELVVASYCDAFLSKQGVAVVTARAGNVIGGGDWSEDRLIPDAVRAWDTGNTLEIRCPQAIRPWQHVLEPLAGYLTLAEKIWANSELAGAFNFGPETNSAATVKQVIQYANECYGRGEITYGETNSGPHEAGSLTLEIAKTTSLLGISPKWSLEQAIEHTMDWYLQFSNGADPNSLCSAEISEYESVL